MQLSSLAFKDSVHREQATIKVLELFTYIFFTICLELKFGIFDEVNDEESFHIGRDGKVVLEKLDRFYHFCNYRL